MTPAEPTRPERTRWRRGHAILVAVLVALALWVTANAWADTFRLSLRDEEVQYVLVAPVLVGWMAWVRRARLVHCRARGMWVGPLLILIGWLAWSYGYRRSVPTLWHGGPIVVVVGAVLSVTGVDVLRRFLPAFAAMIFLIPITPTRRHIFAAPLERLAAEWTRAACELLGLHVTRMGNLLSVNGVQVEVAEACNGMRQLVTFGLVCYAMAFGQPYRWYVRLTLLALVPVVAIAGNVVRLVPTVWVYSHGTGEGAQQFHDLAGWAMLVVALALIQGTLATMRWATVPMHPFPRAVAA